MHPSSGVHAHWAPNTHTNRFIDVEWSGGYGSKATSGAPVHCSHGSDGINRLTFAWSDALNSTNLKAGLREESAELSCSVTAFTESVPPLQSYEATLRLDTRPVPLHQSIREVSDWWAAMPEYAPVPVPEIARLPMYSTWYSFHQHLEPAAVEEQCRQAKALGCEAVIVDDGWQTDDNSRGYAYCGDWEVTPGKIPDMRAHVQRVHDLGMKYLLWYSVPFVGPKSRAWEQFQNKLLRFIPGTYCRRGSTRSSFSRSARIPHQPV
jgi:alpha-galactosidase